MEQCNDNRHEIIKETKEYIIRATNIDTDKDEMKVLDSICFRLWQLGLTKRNKDRLYELTKSPTLEEVKKEWEELGWYWHYFYNENGIANKYRITKYVPSRKRDGSGDYQLEIYLCNNTKTFNINFNMDMQEYQLLTKTFKALGWL